MGWKDDARRTTISERIDLVKIKGYWVKVRIWSVSAKDEISAAMKKVQKGLDKKALMSFALKAKAKGADLTNESELLDLLTPDEIAAFVDSESVEMANLIETKLRLGIAEHNFEGCTVEELAHDVLEFPTVAEEILAHLEEFNRPLVPKKSAKSETALSGSIAEPPLITEIVSLTEANPPS